MGRRPGPLRPGAIASHIGGNAIPYLMILALMAPALAGPLPASGGAPRSLAMGSLSSGSGC